MNNPFVSIIIPTYNRAHLISETLDSLLSQTYQNWECIIVDDGSTDTTEKTILKYVEKDSRFRYFPRPTDRPKGANTCRNYGFELSQGEFVNWFDSDDIMLPEFLSKKMDLFSEGINLVICSGYLTNESLENKRATSLEIQSNIFKDYALWRLRIFTPSIVFRKSFLPKELFSAKISRGQETELFSRLFFKLDNSEYKIVNEPLFLYRHHPESKTHKNTTYVNAYKESQAYIMNENLKKSIEISDNELISYYYRAQVELFFRSIENKHFSNSRFILTNLLKALKKNNRQITFELSILGKLFLLLKRGSYKIEKRWESFKIS